jgi:hypothetical protein
MVKPYIQNIQNSDKEKDSDLISLKEASKLFGYTPHHFGLLCRQGKLKSGRVGKKWFTKKEWIEEYLQSLNEKYKNGDNHFTVGSEKIGVSVSGKHQAKVSRPISKPVSQKVAKRKTTTVSESWEDSLLEKKPQAVLKKTIEKEKVEYKKSEKPDLDFSHFLTTSKEKTKREKVKSKKVFVPQFSFGKVFWKTAAALSVIVIAVLIFRLGVGLINPDQSDTSPLTTAEVTKTGGPASFWSAIKSFASDLRNFAKGLGRSIKLVFFKEESVDVYTKHEPSVFVPPEMRDGMVVIPEFVGLSQIKMIQDSFSDEVSISPDEEGDSGVIQPIFKEGKGDEYIYVMVPVKEEEKETQESQESTNGEQVTQ